MKATPILNRVWTAEVDIGERQSMGRGPLGHHDLVPILGDHFEDPTLRGQVLPGALITHGCALT